MLLCERSSHNKEQEDHVKINVKKTIFRGASLEEQVPHSVQSDQTTVASRYTSLSTVQEDAVKASTSKMGVVVDRSSMTAV